MLLILSLFISNVAFCDYNWTELHPQGLPLEWRNVVQNKDGTRILACSDHRLFKSDDSGNTWTQMYPAGFEVDKSWKALAISDNEEVYIAGIESNAGPIYISKDKGNSWSQIPCGNISWYSADCSSDGKVIYIQNSSKIYVSKNSGTTWNETILPVGTFNIKIMCSSDGAKVVLLTDTYLYLSSDYGATWYTTSPLNTGWDSGAISDNGQKIIAQCTYYESGSLVYNYIYKSTDFGNTWTLASSNTYSIKSLSGNGAVVLLGDNAARLFKSNDFMDTPPHQIKPGNLETGAYRAHWIAASCSYDGSKIVSVDYYPGYIYVSNNSGLSWLNTSPPAANRNWQFLNTSSDGRVLFLYDENGWNYYNISRNYGAKFLDGQTNPDYYIKSCALSSNGARIYAGDRADIWTSSDTGSSWSKVFDSSISWTTLSCSSDGNTAYAGNTSRFYYTINGGGNWTERRPAGDVNKNWKCSACSSDGSKVYAGVYGGRLYYSSDKGQTTPWTEIRPAGDADKNWSSIICSSDGAIVVASVYGGRIYKSINSGNTWTELKPVGSFDLQWKMLAGSSDLTRIFAACYGGRIFMSTNSGNTWSEMRPSGDIDKNWSGLSTDATGKKVYACVYGGRAYTGIDPSVSSPVMTTTPATSITSSMAQSGGNIASDGGATVIERGICWGTDHNPTVSNDFVKNGSGVGGYTCALSGLSPATTYYVRAYAVNMAATVYGNEITLTTLQQYTLTYSAGSNGTLTGVTFQSVDHGANGTAVTAVPNTGYHFTGWSDSVTDNPRTDLGVTGSKSVTASFAINDVQITTNLTSLSVNEGFTNNFQVKLTMQPTASKTVSVSRLSGDSDITVSSGSSLTFTTANWNTYQTVTLAAAQDADVSNGLAIIRCSSTGMTAKDITANESDNDTAGFTLSKSVLTVSENGGTGTFTVVLTAQPDSNVVFSVASSATGEVTVTPATLTFTAGNWNTAQTVTIAGVNDNAVGNDIATITVSVLDESSDNNWVPLADKTVAVTCTNDDVAGFAISAISGNTTEAGGTATFTVRLTSQPTANVSIALSSSDTSEGTVSPASLTFTPANWNTNQTVTVTGVDDPIADGNIAYSIVTAPASSVDLNYNGLNPPDVSVTNIDNDAIGIAISAISGNTTEAGGTATFTVRLTSQPTANVSISLSSSDTSEGTVSPVSLTFTSANWNIEQVVTVTGVDDAVVDGNIAYSIVTAAAISADLNYNGLNPSDIPITNIDNDVAGFTLSKSTSTIAENVGTDTFTAVLSAQPDSNVVLGVTSFATGHVTVAPGTLTFTPANWNNAQSVTITGVNDNAVSNDSATVTVSVVDALSDNKWDPIADKTVAVTCINDDYILTVNNAGNGATVPSGASVQTKGAGASIGATPDTGYHFINWTVTSGSATFGGEYSSSTTATASADATICANFAINTYTVIFDLAGKGTKTGGGELSQIINHGSAASEPTFSAKPGWTFTGWDKAFANVTSNRTVTAKWEMGPPVIVDPGAQKAMVGVLFTLPVTVASESSPVNSVTLSGLPSGLKFDSKTMTITGVPTVPVSRKEVTITAKNAFKTPELLIFVITVDPLLVWAQGAFNGSCVLNNDSGAATMTVTTLGKVTGKLLVGGGNYAFSEASYLRQDEEGAFLVSTEISVDKTNVPLTLKVSNPAGINPPTLSIVEGWFSNTTEGEPSVKMYRNVWKDTGMATTLEPYIGYYTTVLPGGAEYGSGYLALAVDKTGTVKTTGKLADGMALSLSGPLILDEAGRKFVVMYTSPTAYKGGYLFGLAEFKKPEGEGHVFLRLLDGVPFHWENRNPLSTSEYDGDGFIRDLGLSGGWYDKIGNLYDYYQNKALTVATDPGAAEPGLTVGVNHYMSDWWDFSGIGLETVRNSLGVMTNLSAPKAKLPLKVNGEWNYTAVNTVGLNIGLTRPTGIFKGSFKVWFDYDKTHTSKSISYEGVLTPEREDKEDGVEGRGFFLWADKSGYVNPLGRTVTYPFNWSYDFLVLGDGK